MRPTYGRTMRVSSQGSESTHVVACAIVPAHLEALPAEEDLERTHVPNFGRWQLTSLIHEAVGSELMIAAGLFVHNRYIPNLPGPCGNVRLCIYKGAWRLRMFALGCRWSGRPR